MDKKDILQLLEQYSQGEIKQEEAADRLSSLGLEELGFATLDTDRLNRTGIPEVIYSAGKTPRQVAEIAGQYLRKGSKVYVEGSLRTRKWQDQSGQDRYTTEIVANEMQMLDRRGGSAEYAGGSRAAAPQQNQPAAQNTPVDNGFEDDIPF